MGAQGDALAVFADLVARYGEAHRAYHILAHIEHCLNELDKVRHLCKDPEAVEMAIWYHDAIYDIGAMDNEEWSARLACEIAQNALLPESFGQKVADLIRATNHDGVPVDPDAQLLTDIDLSILGQPEERFDEYERQVRKEHEDVPWEKFARRRAEILKQFLARPAIYSTKFFLNTYEAQAWRNIARSLTRLSA